MLPAPKLSETVNLCRFFLLSERCYAFVGKDDMMCYGKVSLLLHTTLSAVVRVFIGGIGPCVGKGC
jgi:hypothetical protein